MTTATPLKIMIVDDDYDDRELLRFLFSNNEKFELVGCFSTGTEVVNELVTNNKILDILLIDLYMPLLSGLETIAKLEESNVASGVHKFIISSNIASRNFNNNESKSIIHALEKPVSLKEINDLPGIILERLNYTNNTKI